MNGIKITTLCIAIVSIIGMANAETCVKTTYNVIYGCGDGTEIGTLPADAVANYNTSFTPATLTSACKAPPWYKISGWSVYIDGVEHAYTTSSFTYSFTADSLITPNYVPNSSAVIATPADLAVNLQVSPSSSSSKPAASGTWQAMFPYGIVNGVSKCTKISPENTATGDNSGLIATNQSAIENATAGGTYCYCKMTEPYVAASPWVFANTYSRAEKCASSCSCPSYLFTGGDNGRRFRASVFAGAVAEMSGN